MLSRVAVECCVIAHEIRGIKRISVGSRVVRPQRQEARNRWEITLLRWSPLTETEGSNPSVSATCSWSDPVLRVCSTVPRSVFSLRLHLPGSAGCSTRRQVINITAWKATSTLAALSTP